MIIALIILLSIVLLIALLLSLFISLRIRYNSSDDVFSVTLRILCFNLRIIPKKEKKVKKKKAKQKKKDKPKESKSKNIFKKVGFFDTLKFISNALSAIFGLLSGVVNNSKIKKLRFVLNISQGDAASTAISCGYASSVVYPVVGKILDSVKDYKNYDVQINPDYDEASKSSIDLDVIVGIRVFSLIKVVFSKWHEIFSVLKTLI